MNLTEVIYITMVKVKYEIKGGNQGIIYALLSVY